jgi:hypothetical protein
MQQRNTTFVAGWVVLILVVAGLPRSAAAAPTAYVAYIVRIVTTQQPSSAVRVRRSGVALSVVGDRTGLIKGDEVFVLDERAVLVVRMLGSGETVMVRKVTRPGGAADWLVPDPGVGGAPPTMLDWFISLLEGPESSLAVFPAGARGLGEQCHNPEKTNTPTPFTVPTLVVPQSYLVAGHQTLVVAWQGGVAPFDVRLSSADDGREVAMMHRINDCAARFPSPGLKPGRYRLSVTDALGVQDEQDDLRVVLAGPPLPTELSTADLSGEGRILYGANWLVHVDQGRWAFEALQQVASLDCHVAAVQGWLRQWGAAGLCSSAAGLVDSSDFSLTRSRSRAE